MVAPLRRVLAAVLPGPLKRGLRRVASALQRRVYHLTLPWMDRRAAEQLLARLPPNANYDVLIFPIIDFTFRFQRPQQLACQLARCGHRVIYLATGLGAGGRSLAAWVAPGVATAQLPGPPSFDLYRHQLADGLIEELLDALAGLRQGLRLEHVVCLVQFPTWRPLAEAARLRWGWRLVYDCMDEHAGFSLESTALVEREERALVAASDLTVVTSGSLEAKWGGLARRLLRLPNAADFERFHDPAPPPPALAGLMGPIIGYYGAIAHWFDVGMVAEAARARPGWSFVLVGSTVGAEVAPLRELGNVHLMGEQPYESLPGYLQRFDVALIPFLRMPLTEATNPVKLYEYFSAGKPVLAVELPELAPFAGLFYPIRDAVDLVRQAEVAMREPDALAAARVRAVRGETWRHRVAQLREAVRVAHPRVALVIVAYAEASRLRACLDSVWTHTQHPNLVVVVVDNSGSAPIRSLLEEEARREPRLRVVYNEENEGFPRANNRGIAAAGSCEYVVLLNDDTVVTRGWLSRLLHHLDEPGVALVGPVTNWAGNEARIDVPYQRLADMERFAESYTREHEGRAWDIPMLAMFCVAMRRDLLDRIGPLDERFGIGMFEDDDFARRVRAAGGRLTCAEDVFVHHWGRASFGEMSGDEYERLFDTNRRLFEEKWGEPWQPHRFRAQAPAATSSRRPFETGEWER